MFLKWLYNEESEKLSEFLINEAHIKFPDFKKDNMTMIVINLKNIDKMKDFSSSDLRKKKEFPLKYVLNLIQTLNKNFDTYDF